jgi:hypothetical protein
MSLASTPPSPSVAHDYCGCHDLPIYCRNAVGGSLVEIGIGIGIEIEMVFGRENYIFLFYDAHLCELMTNAIISHVNSSVVVRRQGHNDCGIIASQVLNG